MTDKPEIIVAVAGLIVSICALGYTAYQAYLSREHNKLSVKPSLSTWSETSFDEEIKCIVFEATLMNAGLGPAYIKSYEILIDEQPIYMPTFDDIHDAIQQAFPHYKFDAAKCYYGLLRKKHVVAANERTMIGKLVILPTRALDPNDLKRLNIRVVYESAYGEEQIYDSKEHHDIQL
jgi:hypothetical protein